MGEKESEEPEEIGNLRNLLKLGLVLLFGFCFDFWPG